MTGRAAQKIYADIFERLGFTHPTYALASASGNYDGARVPTTGAGFMGHGELTLAPALCVATPNQTLWLSATGWSSLRFRGEAYSANLGREDEIQTRASWLEGPESLSLDHFPRWKLSVVRTCRVTVRTDNLTFCNLFQNSFESGIPHLLPDVKFFLSSDVVELHDPIWIFDATISARVIFRLTNRLTAGLNPVFQSRYHSGRVL